MCQMPKLLFWDLNMTRIAELVLRKHQKWSKLCDIWATRSHVSIENAALLKTWSQQRLSQKQAFGLNNIFKILKNVEKVHWDNQTGKLPIHWKIAHHIENHLTNHVRFQTPVFPRGDPSFQIALDKVLVITIGVADTDTTPSTCNIPLRALF